MSQRQHRHVTLVMSLILMIFSICQAQARAQLPAMPSGHHHAGEAAQHETPATQATDCHGDCLQLTAHPDPGHATQLPDASPGLLAWLPVTPLPDAASSRVLAYRPPAPSAADPPPLIRFQRFLN